MAEVALRGVAKRYGRVEVIHGIDLDIRHGEFTVFVGPSGCGKSTLLRMIAGLEPISDGEVRIGGRRVNELPPRQRDIAMVFQDYALYPHKTLYENMAFGLRLRGTADAEIRRRVDDAARLLRIDHMLDRRPAALSGGQRQRVAIGRAIVREPQVFLFDEPLSNLDAQLRNEMRSEIKRLHQRLGATIIYVTHDQVEAMTLADRIAVLSAGRLMQYDTPDAIYNRPAALFVAGFTGAPPMNLADCTLSGDSADLGGLALALPPALAARARMKTAPFKIGVRPENLLAAAPAAAALRLPAQVSLLEPLGSETLVTLRLGRAEMIARWPAAFRAAPGTAVDVHVDPGHLHLFEAASGAAV
ncbi:MAG: sn-glycerol-3-phosphate ABC transporter ATP-binding protein UgpC [Burkholderiales bacterium]|nr:sn-glycerol-3-phosphate ABC transporter ATP-binding protein UgpC [Burkholderiales bacterium]